MRFQKLIPYLTLAIVSGCDNTTSPYLLSKVQRYNLEISPETPSQKKEKTKGLTNTARTNAIAIHQILFKQEGVRKQSFSDGSLQSTFTLPFSNGWYHVEARVNPQGKKALAILAYRGVFQNQTFSYDGFPHPLDGIIDKSNNDFFPGTLVDTHSTKTYYSDLQNIKKNLDRITVVQ